MSSHALSPTGSPVTSPLLPGLPHHPPSSPWHGGPGPVPRGGEAETCSAAATFEPRSSSHWEGSSLGGPSSECGPRGPSKTTTNPQSPLVALHRAGARQDRSLLNHRLESRACCSFSHHLPDKGKISTSTGTFNSHSNICRLCPLQKKKALPRQLWSKTLFI